MGFVQRIKKILKKSVVFLLGFILLAQSVVAPGNKTEQIRAFTRMIEFDYINWTLDALLVKNVQESIKAPRYMSTQEQRKVVFEYLRLVQEENQDTDSINKIYADPDVVEPDKTAAVLNERLRRLMASERSLKPLAEAVLQHQVSTVVSQMGLGLGGQPMPPVMYHATRLPNALIISPRDAIRQDLDISLQPEMTTKEMAQLEDSIENRLDVSALVVPIGGVGTYPTMVMNTTDLNWLLEVISHEWTHNFLTLRPLGALYLSSQELRTINETTANISGKEIGRAVLERYYPELVPLPASEDGLDQTQGEPAAPPEEDPNVFHYNREMHETRVQVDQLLAEGKIKEAEDYMEGRRRFFWEHGYQIRKLNQAFFAFYGAYDDVPGAGAAGQDPVGPAVQKLRRASKSLVEFLNRISWMTSFEELQRNIQ